MGADLVNERAGMLAKTGSFWYRGISEDDKHIAFSLTQLAQLTNVHVRFNKAMDMALCGGYSAGFYKVVHFGDKDIVYFGQDAALQKRFTQVLDYETSMALMEKWAAHGEPWTYGGQIKINARRSNLELDATAAGTDIGDLTLQDYPVIIPTENTGTGEFIVLPANYRTKFGLLVDKDIMVTSINAGAQTLFAGVDFKSTYGYISFTENPIHLFPDMKFMAASYVERHRNVMSYSLQVNNVYGPADRIVHYYRVAQNIKSLYPAAAQAAGMAVLEKAETVKHVLPLLDGHSYIMLSGKRYDAPYRHDELAVDKEYSAGTVIGGEMFRLEYGNTAEVLGTLGKLHTGYALPVPNMEIPDKVVPLYAEHNGERVYRPSWAPLEYKQCLAAMDGHPADLEATIEGHAVQKFLEDMGNQCLIVRVNGDTMSETMQLHLDAFLQREAPIGSVLTYAPLGYTIDL